ncbi:MAG: DUF4124 domain-containing protein [Nitrospiraceae bacterium]|nr:DUF4124 domain-containing protein [Nitrospiraceae bacterium]
MKNFVMFAACILLLFASNARADFYRWVDRDGKEFFTNDPKQVPQEYRAGASTIKPDESRVSVGKKPTAPGPTAIKSSDHRDKYGRGEEYWRKRADKYRQQLRDLQYEKELVEKKEKDEEDTPKVLTAKRKKTLASREKKKALLEKKIELTRKKLEVDLPEEARRADAYPGWVRE